MIGRAGAAAIFGAILALSAGPAAPEPDAPSSNNKPTRLSELLVRQPSRCLPARRPPDKDVPAPKVIDSYPKEGAVVRPGVIVLRFTFDLPMTCAGALLQVAGLENPCEGLDQPSVLSFDRRTVRVACLLQPSSRYGVSINTFNRLRFIGMSGWPARQHELKFQTSGDPPLKTLLESLAQDPLSSSIASLAPPG